MIEYRMLNFRLKDYLDYFLCKETLARNVHDKSAIPLLKLLTGNIIEIGAARHDYSIYASNAASYIKSNKVNCSETGWICLDAVNMDLENDAVNGFVCLSTLEHIKDSQKAISEIRRCLKIGGTLLLITPWVFPKHGAPGDYLRYSPDALMDLLSDFKISHIEAVGNLWITIATFLQRPKWGRFPKEASWKPFDVILRILGLVFIFIGSFIKKEDDYALLYSVIAQKR